MCLGIPCRQRYLGSTIPTVCHCLRFHSLFWALLWLMFKIDPFSDVYNCEFHFWFKWLLCLAPHNIYDTGWAELIHILSVTPGNVLSSVWKIKPEVQKNMMVSLTVIYNYSTQLLNPLHLFWLWIGYGRNIIKYKKYWNSRSTMFQTQETSNFHVLYQDILCLSLQDACNLGFFILNLCHVKNISIL